MEVTSRRKIAEDFAKEAVRRYGDRIEEIILYGSVARGKSGKESDIDLLVVSDVPRHKMLWDLHSLTTPVLLNKGELISIAVMPRSEMKSLGDNESFFIKNVREDGIVLYKEN